MRRGNVTNEIGANQCGDHHGGQTCWNPGPHHKKMLKFKVRKEWDFNWCEGCFHTDFHQDQHLRHIQNKSLIWVNSKSFPTHGLVYLLVVSEAMWVTKASRLRNPDLQACGLIVVLKGSQFGGRKQENISTFKVCFIALDNFCYITSKIFQTMFLMTSLGLCEALIKLPRPWLT